MTNLELGGQKAATVQVLDWAMEDVVKKMSMSV